MPAALEREETEMESRSSITKPNLKAGVCVATWRFRRKAISWASISWDRSLQVPPHGMLGILTILEERGMGPTDHVFLHRHLPASKDLIRNRIKAAGARTAVKVTPHCLRHTFATQLVNAGCRITSIQKLMGHRRLDATMVYARVHDRTVADDYYTAMAIIEKQLQTSIKEPLQRPQVDGDGLRWNTSQPTRLLQIIAALSTTSLDDGQRGLLSSLRHGILTLDQLINPDNYAERTGLIDSLQDAELPV